MNIIDRSTYEILMQYGAKELLKLRSYFNAKGLYNGVAVILTIYVLNARNYGRCQNVAVKN